MPKLMSEIKVKLLPKMDSITEKNFLGYFFWQKSSSLVKDFIVSPFEESLIKTTAFNDHNIPNEPKETKIKVSNNLEFKVLATPTTKKVSQSAIVEELFYLSNTLKEQYSEGLMPRGILTIDNQPYVSLEILFNKYEELISLKDAKKGVSNSISSIPSLEEINLEESLNISVNRNYNLLSENNGFMYLTTKKFVKEGDERAKRFKELLEKESLNIMNIQSVNDLREVSLVGYQFDNYSLACQLEPRYTPKYGEILNSFFKSPPNNIKSNSKIGDLEKVKILMNDGNDILKNKGLIDDYFIETYSPLKRDGKIYVKLNGVILRFKEYQEKFTTKSIELNMGIMPA